MSPIRRVAALVLVCAALLAVSSRAPGFALIGDSWPAGTDIVMHLSLSRAPASFPDGSGSWNASAADALQIWNQHLQTVRFVEAGSVPSGNGDGQNSVFFSNTVYGEKFGTNVIAVTVGFTDAATQSVIVETDVIFNSVERWDSYRGPQRNDARGNPIFDLHRVALHEFGHVLGLNHPDAAGQFVSALMNSRTDDNDNITDDDIAGARHLYGVRITSSLSAVTVDAGRDFFYQIAANNSPSSYSAGGLPAGLSVDGATGAIRGSPAQSGTFNVTIVATGRFGSASATLQIVVRAPRILSSLTPFGVEVGQAFRYQIMAEGNPDSFSTSDLPHGLILDANSGLISGVPTVSDSYAIVVRAHTAAGDAVATVQIRVVPGANGDAPIARFSMSAFQLLGDPLRGRVYAASFQTLAVIDARTLTIVKQIPLGASVSDMSLSADKTKLLFASRGRRIDQVDLDKLEVLPSLAIDAAAERVREGAGGRLYVSEMEGGIAQVDAITGATRARFTPVERGFRPKLAIEISPDGKTLFAAELIDTPAPHLTRYDISTAVPSLLQSVPVAGYSSSSLALSNTRSLVTFDSSRSADVRSASDLNAVVATLSMDSRVLGPIAFAADDSLAFVSTRSQSMFERNVIGVFDLTTFQRIRTLVLPQALGLSRMAFDTATGHLFVFSTGGAGPAPPTLEVYDVKTRPQLPPLPKRLLNVSTRMRAAPGDLALIGGFIISGDEPVEVGLRAIGPSLPVEAKLLDPTLTLYNSAGERVAANENWNSHRADVLRTGLAPSNERESVVIATLAPGGYTAVVNDATGASGIALVELYDLRAHGPAKLANISTRGKVETGDNVMIGGFIIGGDQPTRVIIRAIGPSLAGSGVAGALENTALELYDGNGAMIAANDDWRDEQPQDIAATTIPPTDDRESAIVRTLLPGNYTAVVRGKDDATGVALVEVYNLEP